MSSAVAHAAGTEITVYNQGFALVKEQRQLNLKTGQQTVAVEDVAQMIEANSVAIKSLSAPGSFTVLEQNYQYDLISPIAILNKVVGKEVIFNRVLPNGTKERVVGILMSAPTAIVSNAEGGSNWTYNGVVIKTNDGRILLNPSGEIEVASIPDGLISKPTLLWMLDSDKAGPNTVELSYITGGTSWKADYVLSLDGDGKIGDLKGWVTLTNNSGATWMDAQLKLLAGDVQRAQQPRALGGRGGAVFNKAADAGFAEEQFADYHLYTLQRPTTVRDKEIKQVSLLEAFRVPVTKKLVVDSMKFYRGYQPNEGQVGMGEIKPLILIELVNNKASQLGMPLPAGTFKVFQRDKSGSMQMLGEDRIEHTPKEEKVSLAVGRAFDIVAERKRTEFAWIRSGGNIHGAKETFEIELRNRKETEETVTVIERHWYENKIIESNVKPTHPSNEEYVFTVVLKPNEVRKIVYTIETRW